VASKRRWSNATGSSLAGSVHPRDIVVRGRISEPTEDVAGRTKLGLSLAAELDRTAFGVDWNAPLPGGGLVLADQVSVTAELQFVAP